MTELVERARAYVLDFFNADPAEYTAIFTANASGALKLVGEAYPFAPGGHYALTADNHNSVNGIREFAKAKGARVTLSARGRARTALDEAALDAVLAEENAGTCSTCSPSRPNPTFPGCSTRWAWIEQAHAQGWDVLLDAAAFAPTNRLDLSVASARFCLPLVLQDLRLSHRRGLAARPAGGPDPAAPTLVCRGDDHHRLGGRGWHF